MFLSAHRLLHHLLHHSKRNACSFYAWCNNIAHSIWKSVNTHTDNHSHADFITNTNVHWHCNIAVQTMFTVMHNTQDFRHSGTPVCKGGREVSHMTKIKVSMSADKATPRCKTGGQPVVYKRVVVHCCPPEVIPVSSVATSQENVKNHGRN